MILAITGPKGIGKTTTVEHLLELYSNTFEVWKSTTTRRPKLGIDESLTYNFINDQELKNIAEAGDIFTSNFFHGSHFLYRKSDFRSDEGKIKIITPQPRTISQYSSFDSGISADVNLARSCFIVSLLPDDVTSISFLKDRLIQRDGNADAIPLAQSEIDYYLSEGYNFCHACLIVSREMDRLEIATKVYALTMDYFYGSKN